MIPFNNDSYLHAEIARLIGRWDVEVAFETGTFEGHSTVALSLLCEMTYTVEIVEKNREQACAYFETCAESGDIISLFGSSPEMIDEVAEELAGKRVLYFLDAHWEDDWPILDELAAIVKIKGPKPVIVIHDFLVPKRPDLGFDTYHGQVLDFAFVEAGVRGIYEDDFEFHYNRLASGAQRGVLFLEPLD